METIVVGSNRYGKANVHFLRVVRDTPRHEVYELRGHMLLEGSFDEAFTTGSNKLIVPTDTQKNTLYAFAKKFDIEPLEKWMISAGKDMMQRHSHISAVNIDMEELPWERVKIQGQDLNHAFQKALSGNRICRMRLGRDGSLDMVSGFKDMQIMKTTQSGFTGYIKDEYTTLKETTDRVMSTKVKCEWTYNNASKSIEYSYILQQVKKICIELFAGDPTTGIYSASVQETIFQIGKDVLERFPKIEKISLSLPNIHYFLVDFNQFKANLQNKNEVFMTWDGPHGLIEATIERKHLQQRSTRAKL